MRRLFINRDNLRGHWAVVTFRGRLAKGRRGYFTGFNPAITAKARKAKCKQIQDWHLNRRSSADLSTLAREINPQVQGWINYYGAFYRSGRSTDSRR